jgi:hypothetical protein
VVTALGTVIGDGAITAGSSLCSSGTESTGTGGGTVARTGAAHIDAEATRTITVRTRTRQR